jgi:hypothetical protein
LPPPPPPFAGAVLVTRLESRSILSFARLRYAAKNSASAAFLAAAAVADSVYATDV